MGSGPRFWGCVILYVSYLTPSVILVSRDHAPLENVPSSSCDVCGHASPMVNCRHTGMEACMHVAGEHSLPRELMKRFSICGCIILQECTSAELQ